MMAVSAVCRASIKAGAVIGDIQLQLALTVGQTDFHTGWIAVQRRVADGLACHHE